MTIKSWVIKEIITRGFIPRVHVHRPFNPLADAHPQPECGEARAVAAKMPDK
jgi:hypothetical protein